MPLTQITEARTWVSHTLTEDVSVDADTTILELTTIINNTDVSIVNFQAFFASAGKLYLETASDKKHYLTDPSVDWPANYQILTSYFLKKNDVVLLKYSVDTTMTGLIITHTGGVF